MATQKQIEANRKNAKKSTGPKTPDGKAIIAQNATKHGLTAQKPLIPGEDPDQFAIFNESMLADLAPQGPLETVLANRITTLTWQLNRAPRIQAAAFNYMIDDVFDPPRDPEKRLGKAIVRDIANYQTLEKLQSYEQRIENNLYKTIEKLEKIQLIRKKSEDKQPKEPGTPTMNRALNAPTTNYSKNKPNLYAHGVPCPDLSTNHEPKTTNSIPQNKPNSKHDLRPEKMSSQAIYELPTRNSKRISKNKANLNI